MTSRQHLDLRDDLFREFRPGFQPLSPHESSLNRAMGAADSMQESGDRHRSSTAIQLDVGEPKHSARDASAATAGFNQPFYAEEPPQYAGLQNCDVYAAYVHGRCHSSILQLEFEPAHPSSAASPLQPACHSTGDKRPYHSQPSRRLAVRHTLGVSIFLLDAEDQAESQRACLKPVCYVPAVMDVVALHWSLFLPGQLLYTCCNLDTFIVQFGGASIVPESAPTGPPVETPSSSSEAHRLPSQPRLAVVAMSVPLSSRPEEEIHASAVMPVEDAEQETMHLETVAEEVNTDGHGVSLCVVSHPQRLVLATGSCIYVSEITLAPGAPPAVWTHFINTEASCGPISSLATPPWYGASYPHLADVLRHLLFVGCKHAVLAFHMDFPAAPMLSTSMPPHVKEGCILSADVCQHLLRFPSSDVTAADDEPEKHGHCAPRSDIGPGELDAADVKRGELPAARMHASQQAKRGCNGDTGDKQNGERVVGPTGVVGLGYVVGMCRNDGHMFVCPWVVTPALRGLMLLPADGTRAQDSLEAKRAHSKLENFAVRKTGKKSLLSKSASTAPSGAGGGEFGKEAGGCSIQAVYLPVTGGPSCSNCLRPSKGVSKSGQTGVTSPAAEDAAGDSSSEPAQKRIQSCVAGSTKAQSSGHHVQDDIPDRQGLDTTADVRQEPVPAPWMFAESAAAQWLGTPLVFGFPIKAHMHALPRLRSEVAAAEAVCTQATARDAAAHAEAAAQSSDDGGAGEEAEKGAAVGVGVGPQDVILGVSAREPGLKQRVGERVEGTAVARDADQKTGFVMDVMRMHDVCADNVGCAVRWVDAQDPRSHACLSCTQSDLIAGALLVEELVASGDGAVFYERLVERFSKLKCVRSTCCGSVVAQEFAWHNRNEGSLSPILPERLVWKLPQRLRTSCCVADVHAAVPASVVAGMPPAPELRERRQFADAEQYMKPSTGLLEGSQTFAAWRSKCTTCSVQLQGFLHCWNSSWSSATNNKPTAKAEPSKPAAAPSELQPRSASIGFSQLWRWRVPRLPYPAQDGGPVGESGLGSGCDSPTLQDADAFSWPFDDPQMVNIAEYASRSSTRVESPWAVLVSAALEEVLPMIEAATTVAELWAAVLHLLALHCGPREVVSQQLEVEKPPERSFGGIQPRKAGLGVGAKARGAQQHPQVQQSDLEAADRCCDAQGIAEDGAPFCCREAGFDSVWARRVQGDASKMSRDNVRALFAADESSAAMERARDGGIGAVALQDPVECGKLPGRLITGYKTVHACATKRQATDLKAQLESSRVLLRLDLPTSSRCSQPANPAPASSSAENRPVLGAVGLGTHDILGLVVIQLREIGPDSNLQLLHCRNPCWFVCPSLTSAGTVGRHVAAVDVHETGSSSEEGFVSLNDWVLLPVGEKSDQDGGKKSGHELRIDQDTFGAVTEEVKERVKEVLDDWD